MSMETGDRLLIRGVHLASFAPGAAFEQRDGAVLIEDGRIAWLGAESDLPAGHRAAPALDGQGAWLTPGFIDCHTHLVWAGNRAAEFEQRL
jgi:imidazolonepropionase